MKLHTIFQNSSRNLRRDNYGRYIEDLKDAKGTLLTKKIDINSWSISKAKTLEKLLI
jgi:hypothetical protein